MIKDPATQTKIDSTGLRYKSKVNGSPFGPEGNHLSTRSCFKCGQHKLTRGHFNPPQTHELFWALEPKYHLRRTPPDETEPQPTEPR